MKVQLIYQSCGTSTPNGESCNCGVAVRSGDDVFVVDRCRLKPEACTDADCRMMKVTLFVNGDLTPGTRIFKTDGGLSYEVRSQKSRLLSPQFAIVSPEYVVGGDT